MLTIVSCVAASTDAFSLNYAQTVVCGVIRWLVVCVTPSLVEASHTVWTEAQNITKTDGPC